MAVEDKIYDTDEFLKVRTELTASGKVLVQCHGCFDIVHPGHIRYLQFAKAQGDLLVVSVSGDDVVNKGFDRPYINEDLRMENLAALEFVDYVIADHNTWAGPVLKAVKPDIYIKGKEYETNADPRFLKEQQLVEAYGGRVIFSSGDVIYSSTHIISQFRQRFSLDQQKINAYCRRHKVTLPGLTQLLTQFYNRRVLVLGDPILDHYVHCDALNVAAESPMLSVTPYKEEWFLGGAAMIAKQMSRLGAQVGMLMPLGSDEHATRFSQMADTAGIALHSIPAEKRATYVKTRYLVDTSKAFKVNHGHYAPTSTLVTQAMISSLDDLLNDYEALIVTDFGYGLFGSELATAISNLTQKRGIPYYVDVSHTGKASILKFHNARFATPTEPELRFAFGDSESGLSNLASRYMKETQTQSLVLTMGKRGALMFSAPEDGASRLPTDYLPAFSNYAVDTVGAGDSFLSAMVLADIAGAPLSHGLYLGSSLAAQHIMRLGNEPSLLVEFQQDLTKRPELQQN